MLNHLRKAAQHDTPMNAAAATLPDAAVSSDADVARTEDET